jgi:hypothetical protein
MTNAPERKLASQEARRLGSLPHLCVRSGVDALHDELHAFGCTIETAPADYHYMACARCRYAIRTATASASVRNEAIAAKRMTISAAHRSETPASAFRHRLRRRNQR